MTDTTIKGRATSTGLPVAGRKFIGMVYTPSQSALDRTRYVHTDIRCTRLQDMTTVARVALYEEAGVLRVNGQATNLCDSCPEALDFSWQDRAACKDAWPEVDFFTDSQSERFRIIKKWCEACPVQVECFEFAANDEVTSGIFGGMYFSPRTTNRRKMIERRRIELGLLVCECGRQCGH